MFYVALTQGFYATLTQISRLLNFYIDTATKEDPLTLRRRSAKEVPLTLRRRSAKEVPFTLCLHFAGPALQATDGSRGARQTEREILFTFLLH